jgi:hypothetical protein
MLVKKISHSPISFVTDYDINRNYKLENNSVKIKFENILHTQSGVISKKIALTFLEKIESNILIKIICEEFHEPQELVIPITFEN